MTRGESCCAVRSLPEQSVRSRQILAVRRWGIAVAVYVLAVFHRTSLGVAGLQASSRFHISPSQLSVFVLLQLGVYAGMQIPTGILVDRYGPRRLLITASLLMGAAQILFAVATAYPVALFARALLGCGDALTFVSVLRFAGAQFSPRRYPLIVSVTAALGTAGNVVATVPLSVGLRSLGWTPTFEIAGSISLVTGAGVYFLLPRSRPLPGRSALSTATFGASLIAARVRVRTAWSMSGTKTGFWVHFSTMSTSLMLGVLWGVPFMVQAEGLSRTAAGTVLLGNVALGLFSNPVLGYVITRRPAVRVPFAIGTTALTVLSWMVVLAVYSGPMPRLLLVSLVVFTGIGSPASAIAFALARDYNGPAMVGTATGVVNVGGFVAATVASLCVGWTLDLVGSTDRGAYRLAFAVAIAIQLGGLLQTVHWWLRSRHSALRELERGNPVPVPVIRRRWDLT
jgi:MFS family permease